MRARRRVLAGLLLTCALGCLWPGGAQGSKTMSTVMMDDQELVYSTPAQVKETIAQMASLGVDEIKVTLVWSAIAPEPSSARRPRFDAADPAAYPPGAWSRYDLLATLCAAAGIKLFFNIDGPSPLWAIPAGEPQQSELRGRAPDPMDFEQFVEAAGRRYSGSFVPTGGGSTDTDALSGLLGELFGEAPTSAAATAPLPRVSVWSVWNEPNVPGTLSPWWEATADGLRMLPEPSLYRGLLSAAWDGLAASGHTPGTDTILIGETSNPGDLTILPFVRDLYCVGPTLRPLRGGAAVIAGCPTSGSRAGFVAANPALFGASGFAHHPYSYNVAPDRPYPLSSWVTPYNLESLEHVLDEIFSSYGQLPRAGGVRLYLTEFGYESNPPNPYVKNSPDEQARWLNAAEYMAWTQSYVQDFTQFELIDSAPDTAEPAGSYSYWTRSYQTGLEFLGGRAKPALDAFRLPIWVPVPTPGPRVAVWGQLRPADRLASHSGTIEFMADGAARWGSLATVKTANREGFFLTHVPILSAGSLRLAWRDPSGAVFYSRTVQIG